MIDFNAFKSVANQMVQQGLNESHAIHVQDLKAGKLGTYKISSVQVDKNEAARLQEVRAALTEALTAEFGVTSARQLPQSVRNVLDGTLRSGRVMAADIEKIVRTLEDRQAARVEASMEFCKVVDKANAAITAAVNRCGFEGVAIPDKSPLSKALKSVVDAIMGQVNKMTSGGDIRHAKESLAKEMNTRLMRIVNEAFGDEKTPGPLATSLKQLSDDESSILGDLHDAVVDAVNKYVPVREIAKIEKKAMAAEAQRMLGEFNARLRDLMGDDEGNVGMHISTGVPNGCPIADEMSAVLKQAKSVDEVRARMQEVVEKWLGTEDNPSEFANHLVESVRDGKTIGAKRLVFRHEMMMAGVDDKNDRGRLLAYNSVCQLALEDANVSINRNQKIYENSEDDEYGFVFECDDELEALATDPQTYRRISWIMASYKEDVQTMEQLCGYVLKGDCDSIAIFDKQLGDRYLSDAELDDKLNRYSYDTVLGTLQKCRSKLVDDPNFLLYVKQRLGEAPVDMVDGKEVRRLGNWGQNADYRDDLLRMVHRLPDVDPFVSVLAADHSLRSAEGQRFDADDRYKNLKVNDFRSAFNLAGDGVTFKTAAAKTKGQLYLDATGSLKSANRHFGSTVPSTGEENFRLKLAFIDALRQGGADDKFLAFARRMVGLESSVRTQPLSRQAVKAVLVEFHGKVGEGKQRIEVPQKQIKPQVIGRAETTYSYEEGFFGKSRKITVEVQHSKLETRTVEQVWVKTDDSQKIIAEPQSKVVQPPPEQPKVVQQPPQPNVSVQPKVVQVDEVKPNAKSESSISNNVQKDVLPPDYVSPSTIAITHPTGYSELWREPADLFGRMILFVKGSNYIKSHQIRTLSPDDSVVDWVKGMIGGSYAGDVANEICELPGLKSAYIKPEIIDTVLREKIKAVEDLGVEDPVAKFDILATEFARAILKTDGNDPSTRDVSLIQLAMTRALLHRLPNGVMDEILVVKGGGLVHSEEWTFREGGQTYRSSIVPREEVEKSMNISTNRKWHLTGLSRSSLSKTDDDKFGMTFLRFGEVVLDRYAKAFKADLLKELAEQTFLNNATLVKDAKDGDEITLPVVRTDLGGHEELAADLSKFSLTFTPPGASQPITVTIRPQIEHFCLPIDSKHSDNTVINKKEMTLNQAAWKSMRSRAEKYQGNEKEKVTLLVEQIDQYFKKMLDGRDELPAYVNFGAELTRLGARIGVLAALLGDVPSVNCHWGRDRTGVMDNEFKLTMMNLSRFGKLPPIQLPKGVNDPDVIQRTHMLNATGNNQLANQTTMYMSPVNLWQFRSEVRDEKGVTYRHSGLPMLFDEERMPKLYLHSNSDNSVSLKDAKGNNKTADEICNELLNGSGYKIKNNKGKGHCFFYSALDQMSDAGPRGWTKISVFREALVNHLETRMRELGENKLQGLRKIGNFIYANTANGEHPVSDAFFPLFGKNRNNFITTGVNADVSHAAFLADMLKRPVIIIAPDTGTSGASMIKFDRDLETNKVFDNQDPIIMYYNRYGAGGGHFQAVEKKK